MRPRWLRCSGSPLPAVHRCSSPCPAVAGIRDDGMLLGPHDAHSGDHRDGGHRLTSAGRPMLGVTLMIQDHDGKALPTGEDGEVCVRAGNLMRGYWHSKAETDEAMRGDWYHTGDEGHIDAD